MSRLGLVILSFVVVRVPILAVLHGFLFTIREFDFPIFNEIVVGVLVDVTRFFILVFLVLRLAMRRQLQIKPH